MWLGVERKGRVQNMKVITGPAIYYLYSFHSQSGTNHSQLNWDQGIKARNKYLASIFKWEEEMTNNAEYNNKKINKHQKESEKGVLH